MMHDRKYAKLPEVKEVNQCEASKKNIQPFIFRLHTENWIPQNKKRISINPIETSKFEYPKFLLNIEIDSVISMHRIFKNRTMDGQK